MLSRCDLVLVGTSNPENFGAVARLMANFGVSSLTLCQPRVRTDDHRALVVGRAALDRIAAARVCDTLAAAISESSYVVGLSSRRGADRPSVGLRSLADHLSHKAPGARVALVFGPEDTGLLAEHVDLCDVVCGIETPGELSSLNLAQAVSVVLWELSRPNAKTPVQEPLRRGSATRAEIEALLDHAFEALEAVGYFRAGDRDKRRVFLRRMLGAAALTSAEIRGLHGICVQVLRAARATGGDPTSG